MSTFAAAILFWALTWAVCTVPTTPADSAQGVPRMDLRATGTFEVVLKPQAEPESLPGASLGRMSIDKTFQGDLQGTSKGEMLTAVTDTKGSAGYVAIERVTGMLHGRKGTFVFQHTGTMNRGSQVLSISVVPDSGTDQLEGVAGRFMLKIVDGKHYYEFLYSLPQ